MRRDGFRKMQIFFYVNSDLSHRSLCSCHIEKIPIDIYDILPSPFHDQLILRWIFRVVHHLRDFSSFQIIFLYDVFHFIEILDIYDYRHPLL